MGLGQKSFKQLVRTRISALPKVFMIFRHFPELSIVFMAPWVGQQGSEAKGSMGSNPSNYLNIFLLY